MTTQAPVASETTPIAEPRGPIPSAPKPPLAREPRPGLFARLFFPVGALALVAWGIWLATRPAVPQPVFDPLAEWDLSDPVIFGDLGLFTINKGVIYLLLALAGCTLFAVYTKRTVSRRVRAESRTQTVVEAVYEFAHDQIADSLNADPKIFRRYMPYVASIFIFVWWVNFTSFVPLPLNTHHTIGGTDWFYAFGIYAVSSNIFMTLTLALCTFFIYHVEGVRQHGLVGYLGTWKAGQSGFAGGFVWVIEAMTNLVLKPLSLAVRLFANLLSGHVLILLLLALAGVVAGPLFVTIVAQAGGTAIATAFYLFEMVLVVSLQAFIFAVLSAIYIGSAVEQHH
jgi:F-type H+-transporting ATPase subunit a